MSIFAGLSLKEIYIKRCKELRCKANSDVCLALPSTPNDFDSLFFLDVSKNFLGPKGIIPLLDVILCARRLHTIDLRGQNITQKETVDRLCQVVLHHPSILRINLSNNPISIAAASSLLDLVHTKTTVEYIGLEDTQVRDVMAEKIRVQTEKNGEIKRQKRLGGAQHRISESSRIRKQIDLMYTSPVSNPFREEDASRPPTGDFSGAGAAAERNRISSLSMTEPITNRVPLLEVKAALELFPATIHEYLFDENPLDYVAGVCRKNRSWFFDIQFAASDESLQYETNTRYHVAQWKRIGEVYPTNSLFPPSALDVAAGAMQYALPTATYPGTSWLFTCAHAALPTLKDLQQIILAPPTVAGFQSTGNPEGIYTVLFFIDGAWRYVLVDDFIPVNHEDEPLFCQPLLSEKDAKRMQASNALRSRYSNRAGGGGASGAMIDRSELEYYVWPCILEKAVAKLHGGYHTIDKHHDRKQSVLQVGPREDTEEQLRRTLGRQSSCARTLADFSRGVSIERAVHTADFNAREWWSILSNTLQGTQDCCSIVVGMSRDAAHVLPGIEPLHAYEMVQTVHMNGIHLVELVNSCVNDTVLHWRGDWSEVSPLWGQNPEVEKRVLGLREQKRRLAPQKRCLNVGESTQLTGATRDTAEMSAPSSVGIASSEAFSEEKKPMSAVGESFVVKLSSGHGTTQRVSFWMSYTDFLQSFDEIHLCRLFSEHYQERMIAGEWNLQTAGGVSSAGAWYRNPHYHLRVMDQKPFFINVALPDARFSSEEVGGFGFHLVQDDEYPLFLEEGSNRTNILFSTAFDSNACSISFEGVLAASDVYWLVPSCLKSGSCSPFFIRLFSESGFAMTQEMLEDHWAIHMTEQEVPASGPFMMGEDNAQVSLLVDSTLNKNSRAGSEVVPNGSPRTSVKDKADWKDSNTSAKGNLLEVLRENSVFGNSVFSEAGVQGRLVLRATSVPLTEGQINTSVDLTTSNDGGDGGGGGGDAAAAATTAAPCQPESLALFLTSGATTQLYDESIVPTRVLGQLDTVLLAGTPHVLGNSVFLSYAPIAPDHLYNIVCCLQPEGSRALVRFTLWCSAGLTLRTAPLPPLRKCEIECTWQAGSCSYYESSKQQPQIELTGFPSNDSIVVRMDLDEASADKASIMLTVLMNTQGGEPWNGRLLKECVLAQSEYVQEPWVQCIVDVEEEDDDDRYDSMLVIPCLQPVGSFGRCRVSVSSLSGEVKARLLRYVAPQTEEKKDAPDAEA